MLFSHDSVYEESDAIGEVDFLPENARVCEISQCTSVCDNKLSEKLENTGKDYHNHSVGEQIAQRKTSKHTLETGNNTLSPDVIGPPFKKNRGFQFIVNAAKKLN